MNDESERLLECLERATASKPLTDGELDAETARLREGWRALARLLDANASAPAAQPLAEAVRRRYRREVRRRAALAMAASALAIAVGAWYWLGLPSAAVHATRPKTAAAPPAHRVGAEATPSAADPELAWDDSLDDRFAELQRQIVSYDRQQCLDDLNFAVLDRRVDRIVEEMNEL